jgi:hypothetical protein
MGAEGEREEEDGSMAERKRKTATISKEIYGRIISQTLLSQTIPAAAVSRCGTELDELPVPTRSSI